MADSPVGPEIVLNGKRFINMYGCSYFGLSGHPELVRAGQEAYGKYGILFDALRASGVASYPLVEVERNLAEFFGTETAHYFVSGYFISMIGIKALEDRYQMIFMDDTAHYSLEDAAVLTQKPTVRFRHCDAEDLERKIKEHLKPGQSPLILSDGVFATYGNIAPVDQYLKIADNYDGLIFLDEAHAVGCVGSQGRGSFNHFKLESDRIFFGGTLSKAFCSHGAFIPGTREYINLLREKSMVLSGASEAAIPCAAHAAKSLEWVMSHPEIQQNLRNNVFRLKSGLRDLGFEMNMNEVPIATIDLRTQEYAVRIQKELMKKGIYTDVTPYVGADSGGVIRFAIMANHSYEQLDYLLSELQHLL